MKITKRVGSVVTNRKIGTGLAVSLLLAAGAYFGVLYAQTQTDKGYVLEHEADVLSQQTGPHNGGGNTTAFGFFSKAKNSNIVFRKRILHPGSSIGYHLQQANEIYYILSGTGIMEMNGKTFEVNTGDAILTYPGSSHGLKPKANEDSVLIINYLK